MDAEEPKMMQIIIAAILALLSGYSYAAPIDELYVAPKSVGGEVFDGGVAASASARGRWVDSPAQDDSDELMAVSIDCWTVPQPVCEEATATVWENNILLAFHRHYDIVEFSESTQTITAFAGGPSSYNADMKPIGPYVEWRLVMSLQT